jgi:release factor glutamine methyltransferase
MEAAALDEGMLLRDALLEAVQATPGREAVLRRDAELLLAHVVGQKSPREPERNRAWLLAHGDEPIAPAQLKAFRGLVARRAAHEPVQYLVGVQEFYGLRLRVAPEVLIPRPETEHLVEAVLLWAASGAAQLPVDRALRIADVGTGSGAIVIALAMHLAGATFEAIDNSPAALALAEENARAHGCSGRIRFVLSDLLAEVLAEPDPTAGMENGPGLDVVVSNPPYVALRDAGGLQPEVVGFEPHSALFAGEDGLGIYSRLIPQAAAALRPGGLLAMEFGFGQREALEALLSGPVDVWQNVRFLDDYAGIPRVALAERVRKSKESRARSEE